MDGGPAQIIWRWAGEAVSRLCPCQSRARNPLESLRLLTCQITKNSLSSGMATIILIYADLTLCSSAKDRIPPAGGSALCACLRASRLQGPQLERSLATPQGETCPAHCHASPLIYHSDKWARGAHPHILSAHSQATSPHWQMEKMKRCTERMTRVLAKLRVADILFPDVTRTLQRPLDPKFRVIEGLKCSPTKWGIAPRS